MASKSTPDLTEAVRNAATNPYTLVRVLQTFQERIASLESDLRDAVNAKSDLQQQLTQLLPLVRHELSSSGRFPLPIDGLRGQLFDPQPAQLLDFGATTNPSASLYDPG